MVCILATNVKLMHTKQFMENITKQVSILYKYERYNTNKYSDDLTLLAQSYAFQNYHVYLK